MSLIFFKNNNYPNLKTGFNFEMNISFAHPTGVAFESENSYFASGINHGGSTHFTKKDQTTAKNLKEWVMSSSSDTNPVESDSTVGVAYKRIYRPIVVSGIPRFPISQEKLTESFVSLKIILNKLETLFETVEPSEFNKLTYGHKIREILLLACMEVESSWTAVLNENEYNISNRFDTRDYVKLLKAMFLDGYKLSLQSYPSFPSFAPFRDWKSDDPTKSLEWYDAYNKTKHNREENLKFATLENAIKSVGAVVVMFYAQFGFSFGMGFNDQKGQLVRGIFKTIEMDFEKYEKEFYIPKMILDEEPAGHFTPKALDWSIVNYPF